MGNRSMTSHLRGVSRTTVRLPGFLVYAQICIPRAHAHALWLLPWVEALLAGEELQVLVDSPPWPAPSDSLVSRTLLHELIDLRWALPEWSGAGVHIAPELVEAHRREGRAGLARALFDAEVLEGEWWVDGLGGVVLSRQTAAQFDWDQRRTADHVLDAPADPHGLLDTHPPDLGDLIRKLGGVQDLWTARDRAFLASPLAIGERKDVLFTLVGDDLRLLPDELAELEPALEAHATHLLGTRLSATSRVVKLGESPIERLTSELERLPVDPVALGPVAPVRDVVARVHRLVERGEHELAAWLDEGMPARPVLGPTQCHFDALRELCADLAEGTGAVVLITTAFLNPRNAEEANGLADALAEAPDDAQFLVVYGHANDDLPEAQERDARTWEAALCRNAPHLTSRLTVVAAARRSHEKVIVTSAGDWIVGSWNAGSSRPNAAVFEGSLLGRSATFGIGLVDRIANNVDRPDAVALVETLRRQLVDLPAPARRGVSAVGLLRRATATLRGALPNADGTRHEAWSVALGAVRNALQPFLTVVHGQLVDEQQTRDVFLGHVRATRRDVLLSSDRLADSALDGATLRDLRGDGRVRRTVRVVWGREWAGRRTTDQVAKEQLQRARRTVREARELLGSSLLTQEEPMENHAKLLIVDGMRGLITSENLLSYGGEKGRYESRELGVAFWSPVVARHILGRMILQWPDALRGSLLDRTAAPPLDWVVAGNEAWHSLADFADELDFAWETPDFLGRVVRDELGRDHEQADIPPRSRAWTGLYARAGEHPYAWVHEEGARLGLVHAGSAAWRPYDCAVPVAVDAIVEEAESLVASLPEARSPVTVTPISTQSETADPLVARVLASMVEIPAGAFWMGDDRIPEERPRHRVVISRTFMLGRTPVTQGLWEAVMGRLPHLRDVERHPDFPIVHVSYADICQFLEKLNGLKGSGGFELPTEALWEYACRAGADTAYCFGDDPGSGDRPGQLERFAWTKRSSRARLHSVGELQPNAFGLYDMHGLVYETMRDGPRRYTRDTVTDPIGPLDGQRVVARGGFWGRFPVDPLRPVNEHFRCSSRQVYEKSHRVSFRLARLSKGEST